jgi:hemerythrin
MPIHWETEYSVGILKLDDQHRIFIDLINKLHDANAHHRTLAVLNRILDNLDSYTSMHFKDEEHMLSQVGYIRLLSHRNAHRAFSRQLVKYAKQVKDGDRQAAVLLANYLDDWLDKHLDEVDRLYVDYLKKKKIRPVL